MVVSGSKNIVDKPPYREQLYSLRRVANMSYVASISVSSWTDL